MFVDAMGSGGRVEQEEEEDMDCGTTTKIWYVRVETQVRSQKLAWRLRDILS